MSLGNMVGNLTLGKKKYKDVEPDILLLIEKSNTLIARLSRLVSADAEAFYPLSQAYGMPRGTEEEKKLRDEVLQEALIGATEVPMEIARCCCEAIDLLEEYSKIGTRLAISDIGVGVSFCRGALQASKLNVIINTKIMKDQNLKEKTEAELEELLSKGISKADSVYKYVEELLK
jgi:formiminotetrahydrofolate cyclodeaminase